jgi:hypothetical protein
MTDLADAVLPRQRLVQLQTELMTELLEAPVIERLPAILESVESTVLPVTQSAARIRKRLSRLRRR